MNNDVCLTLMPYAGIERPSIALGLLKNCLKEKGITAKVLYPNLWFAEEIGLVKYQLVSNSSPHFLIGEWTFSGAAFPEFEVNHSEYLRLTCTPKEIIPTLWKIREKATSLIERVAKSILALQPRIVSCSSTFQQHCASIALLRRIRQLNPEVITLMGGANCEGEMGIATHKYFPWIDFICSGEGDEILAQLCQQILAKGCELKPSELPYGVIAPCHRDHLTSVGEIPRASVNNLDHLPIPDYDDYFHTLQNSTIAPYIYPALPIETSRGCWWGQKKHCTFCGLNGNGITYRAKSPDRVIQEFSSLSQNYGLRGFFAVDNILDLNHINTVLPIFASISDRYAIFYETKANLRREQLQQLAQAGVRWIQPGIESMHDSILKLLNKGNTALINVQLLKWAKQLGMAVIWNLLMGIPGEKRKWYSEMLAWLPLIVHLQPPSAAYLIRYDRFSPYHEQAQEYGLQLLPYRSYSYIYPLASDAINELAYYFEDHSQTNMNADSHNQNISDATAIGIVPEYEAMQKFVGEWRELFASNNLPQLTIRDHDSECLTIIDTRPCAVKSLFKLEGLACKIYLACDRSLSHRELVNVLVAQYGLKVSWSDIQPIVTELVADKILLSINDKLLSLAISEPITPLPGERECPAGYVDIKSFISERRSSSKTESSQWHILDLFKQ